jgi:hypothetical protein
MPFEKLFAEHLCFNGYSMKIFLTVSLFLIVAGYCYSQDSFRGGLGISISGGEGSGNRNGMAGAISFYSIEFQYVSPKERLADFSLVIQRGVMKTSYDAVFQHSFTGIEAVNKPLRKLPSRFQPYAGLRFGRGKIGDCIEKGDILGKEFKIDNRFVVSPVIGLECFFTDKISADLAFRYDLVSKTPEIRGYHLSAGLKFYLF